MMSMAFNDIILWDFLIESILLFLLYGLSLFLQHFGLMPVVIDTHFESIGYPTLIIACLFP